LVKKLHLIGPTAGRDGLVLSVRQGSATESYTLELDQALVELVESLGTEHGLATARPPEPPGPASASGRAASGLTPREIQARLRGGRTVAEVAEEAGVDPLWIDRFAGPVRAEQEHAVQRAVRLPLATPRRGLSTQALGDAVATNLAERGIPMSEAGEGWSAYHLLGSQWRLRYTFRQRGRQTQAEWQVDMTEGTVTAVNRLGGDLGYVGPEEPAVSAGGGEPGEGLAVVTGHGAPVADGGAVPGETEGSSGGGEEVPAVKETPGDGEGAVEGGEEADEGEAAAEDRSTARQEAPREEEQARREELAQRQEAARQASAAERAAEREAQRRDQERVRAARKEAEAAKRAEARRERERQREEKRRAVAAEKAAAKQQAAAARAAAKRRADEERVTARQAAAEQREDRRRADLAAKAVARREAAAARAATKGAGREEAAARRPARAGRDVPAVDGQLSFEDPPAEAAGARAVLPSAGGPAAGEAGPAAPGAPVDEAARADADLDVPPPAWLEASGQPADEEAPADDDTTGWRRWRLRTGSRRPGPDS
jgi:hypothetical protein